MQSSATPAAAANANRDTEQKQHEVSLPSAPVLESQHFAADPSEAHATVPSTTPAAESNKLIAEQQQEEQQQLELPTPASSAQEQHHQQHVPPLQVVAVAPPAAYGPLHPAQQQTTAYHPYHPGPAAYQPVLGAPFVGAVQLHHHPGPYTPSVGGVAAVPAHHPPPGHRPLAATHMVYGGNPHQMAHHDSYHAPGHGGPGFQSGGFGGASGPGAHQMRKYYTEYADVIKAGQRSSPNFKTAWHAYCEQNGQAMYDPAKHETPFIQGFLDTLAKSYLQLTGGQIVPMGTATPMGGATPMGPGPSGFGAGGGKGGFASSGGADPSSMGSYPGSGTDAAMGDPQGALIQAPGVATGANSYYNQHRNTKGAKGGSSAAATPSSGGAGVGPSGPAGGAAPNGNVAALNRVIELVKQGQRNSAEWKTMWIDWCQENGAGVHDPTRHQACFIIAFVLKYGLAEVVSAPWASPYLVSLGELAKPYMVSTIKKGQSLSEIWKEQWGLFADSKANGTRDPNRHDAGSLMEFFDTIALQQFGSETWMQPYVNGSEPTY